MSMASPGAGYSQEDLADIPGTTIFTIASAARAYELHRFCMSLMKPDNRSAFKADEGAYLAGFAMSADQREAVLARDLNRLIALGGNIYFLVKIANTDGWSTLRAVSTMTGLSVEQYDAMMRAGGRSPDGNRSVREGR